MTTDYKSHYEYYGNHNELNNQETPMCARPKNHYSEEFIQKSIELSEDPNFTIKQVAEKLDINADTLYRWRHLSSKMTPNKQIPNVIDSPSMNNEAAEIQPSLQNSLSQTEKQCIAQLKQKLKQIESKKIILTKAIQIIENQ